MAQSRRGVEKSMGILKCWSYLEQAATSDIVYEEIYKRYGQSEWKPNLRDSRKRQVKLNRKW